ncbi:MAG TPA: VCBS repeat-containing protein [Acidobacteriota bacterium]|nr:VCBS repeat-containing protein [Acidobacteriota bacterium]
MNSDRPNLKNASRQAAGKVFRYALATILLLSLPTFSYFVPKSRESSEQQVSGFEPGKDLRSSPTQPTYRGSAPSGFYGARGFSKRSSSRLVKRNNPRKRSSKGNVASRGRRTAATAQAAAAAESPDKGKGEKAATEDRTERETEGVTSDSLANDFYDDLSGLEGGYNQAQSNLFPRGGGYGGMGGYGGNPFQDALGDDDPQGGDETPTGEGDGEGDPGNTDPPATPVDSDPPAPVPGGDDSPASQLSFLMLYDGGGSSAVQVSRAQHDGGGSFTLEGGERLSLFSGFVNTSSPVLTLGPGKAIMTGDMNDDGLTDAFVVSWEHFGTALQSFLGRGSGGWQEHFSFFWPYQVVQSFALYDFDSDGDSELVAVFSDSANLFIYEITEQGLQYDREVVVPFNATWVVKTHDSGVVEADYLEVFDATLGVSVTFSSRLPGIYSHARAPTYVSSVQIDLDSVPGFGVQSFKVLRYRDRAILYETTGNFTIQLGSFARSPRFPSVIVGDFLELGTRQLIMVP